MTALDARTRAEIGRSSNRRGKEAEQAVARWLREHGWPDAQRTVRTGWRVGDRQSRDRGDIDGTPARLAGQDLQQRLHRQPGRQGAHRGR